MFYQAVLQKRALWRTCKWTCKNTVASFGSGNKRRQTKEYAHLLVAQTAQ